MAFPVSPGGSTHVDPQRVASAGYTRTYLPGAHTWVCPASGRYRFVAKGPGGTGLAASASGAGGGSGAHAERALWIDEGQAVPIEVGAGGSNSVPTATTVTLPHGPVLSAGPGTSVVTTGGLGGVASGGDINIDGSPGGATGVDGTDGTGTAPGLGGAPGGGGAVGGGGGAPGTTNFPGGDGGSYGTQVMQGVTPGGGGSGAGGDLFGGGGDGLVIISREA